MTDYRTLSPFAWENLYHVGMVVPDIRRAIAEISRQMGVAFEEPWPVTVNVRDERGVGPETLTVTFGRQGPPFLELIEGAGGGVWSAEGGPRLHHVGVWTEDLAGEVARLEGLGMRREASGVGPGGELNLFAYLIGADGLRVEMVDGAGRFAMLKRLKG